MVRRKTDHDVVDAGAELERAEQRRIEGERGPSDIGAERRRAPPGSRAFLLVIVACVAAMTSVFTYKAMAMRAPAADEAGAKPGQTVRQIIPALTPRPLQPESAPAPKDAPAVAPPAAEPQPELRPGPSAETRKPTQSKTEKSPEELLRERRLKSALGGAGGVDSGRVARASAEDGGPAGFMGGGGSGGGDLASKLEPMQLKSSKAGRLGNRDMLLTQGTMLDCVLETRMITTQPGMTTCHLTRDIYSANGRVVLLDRGSTIVGFYQGGITQGQARIFVQWQRAETPAGVVIALNSPGTGPLGEAGVGGTIDTHFWERFGGAIMISLIGDLGDTASSLASSRGNGNQTNTLQFSNTAQGMEQAATEALRNSINISPTLYKNQGERVAILVARDLDFSGVYALETR